MTMDPPNSETSFDCSPKQLGVVSIGQVGSPIFPRHSNVSSLGGSVVRHVLIDLHTSKKSMEKDMVKSPLTYLGQPPG